MKIADIAHIRLSNQQLTLPHFKTPKQLIGYMGAIQAQDADMCKWAIGTRLPSSTIKTVNDALDKGDIIRTHVLRPTWHLISREDIYWMIDLTAPQVMAAMRSNDKKLELTEAIFTQSNKLIEKALTGNKHLTREELMAGFKDAGIVTNQNRASHLLMRAECEGIICSGIKNGKHQTYTLLQELMPKPVTLNKDEALGRLAKTYFTSRSPASLKDFVWWSGLSITEARHALEMVKHDFVSETIGDQTYWLNNDAVIPATPKPSIYLLPAFDEYLIAYADRNAVIALKHQSHAFSNNGIFWPVIAVNGQAAGIWKRTVNKDTVAIEATFFKQPAKQLQSKINKAAKVYANFWDKKLNLTNIS
jgi:hypothetical protein